MSNSLTSLLPVLIEEQSIPYLRTRGGLVNRIFTVREQDKMQKGGQSVTVVMPSNRFTPTDVSYSSAAAAQGITLPSALITFNRHKEVKISLNELEARIAQGNQQRILQETISSMMDGLLFVVEQDIASLYANLTQVGSYATTLDDTKMRLGLETLMGNRVDPIRDQLSWRGSAHQYTANLLGIDRYVLATNTGFGIQDGTNPVLTSGQIPRLYNMDAAWSLALSTFAMSGLTVQPSIMFEKYFAAVGFLQFQPASVLSNGSAAVTETYTVDPDSGITLRWQTYYDPALRSMYLQVDACWGYGILDATRAVCILSNNAL